MLLAHEQESALGTPPDVEPVAAEYAPVGTAVQYRDAPVIAMHRGRAESHDPELTLQLGVGLGERVRLEVGRGAVAQLVHLGDIRLARRVAPEVLDEHDALARRLVDLGARRVGLPLVVAGEQIGHAVLRELALERRLVARHAVADRHAVLAVDERSLDRRADRDGEEPVVDSPTKANPAQAKAPAKVIVPQKRDVAVTVHVRLGSESDDRILPLLVGVLLGETEELLVERGPEAAVIHLGEHLVRRRGAVHVDVLEGDHAVLLRDGLAALDRIEPLALVVGVDVGREPALQLLELGLDVGDRGRKRRTVRLRAALVRVTVLRLLLDGLRLLGLPVGVGQVDHRTERLPAARGREPVDGREGNRLLTDHVHHRVYEPHEEPCAGLDLGNVSLRHDTPRWFGLPLIPAELRDPGLTVPFVSLRKQALQM